MASNNGVNPYYLLQPSFATGEISEDVANRVDLDKYQAALTKAENCLIRPHGPAYKRPGTIYLRTTSQTVHQMYTFSNNDENDDVDFLLDFYQYKVDVYKGGVLQTSVATPFKAEHIKKLRFAQSADTLFIASGFYPLKILKKNSNTSWSFGDYSIDEPYFDSTLLGGSENCRVTPNGKSGTVTITSNENIFRSDMVGQYIQLTQDVPQTQWLSNLSQQTATNTSGAYWVGSSWKIITTGTWKGYVLLEYSRDNGATWKQYRKWENSKYTTSNYTESGSPAEPMWLRCVAHTDYKDDWAQEVNFTVESYNKVGYARITAVNSASNITVSVDPNNQFGTTEYTTKFAISPWGSKMGYPMTCCFFQDRLCLGGNFNQPYMLWMSRTGDYANFSVEKADGKVTDDSAVALPFVSRKEFAMQHLVPNTDLIIYTKGNEWILSGNEVISPSSATPKLQTSRGVGDVEPIMIGSKTIYVQARGSTVRDMGYSYETDSYGGSDLTMLNKPIVEDVDITDATYAQEPNSSIYFVRDDGTIAILTYVVDQKVFAWSVLKTDGKFLAVCAVPEGYKDVIYTVVSRSVNGNDVVYLEKFQNIPHSNVPNDYVMLDSAKVINNTTKSRTFVAAHLAGKTVSVLGDGREFTNVAVDNQGNLSLPTEIAKAIIGIPYTMNIQLPNVEIKGGDGTMQGRYKAVTETILRLRNTLGGSVGPNENQTDKIAYDEYHAVEKVNLYNGDKKMQVAIGGFNVDGRISIISKDAYPFDLLAVVRVVSMGG